MLAHQAKNAAFDSNRGGGYCRAVQAWSRRGFLRSLAATGALALTPRWLRASEDVVRISVLHTTDLHGNILPTSNYDGVPDLGGFARCATQIRSWRRENPNHLLVDVGDVYQGTETGFRTRGDIMRRCFEEVGYDGWVIGNHEFDWGPEPLAEFLGRSAIPALSANASTPAGSDPAFSKVQPWVLKEFEGVKIGVIGLTTPGLPYWFRPEFLAGFDAGDPAKAARRAADGLLAAGADIIVIAGHMGRRPQGDDFANQVGAVVKAVPEAAVYLAGHTHREVPADRVDGVLYTQANYYGIHCGRVDLFVDRASRKLIRAESGLAMMDSSVPADPAILSLAARDLEETDRILGSPAGRIAERLEAEGRPSAVELLIGTAIQAALAEKDRPVPIVLHGRFSDAPIEPGPKTVADMWKIIPYENYVLRAHLTPGEMLAVQSAIRQAGRRLSLSFLGVRFESDDVRFPNGEPLDPAKRYPVAMNTYDASSAGNRLPRLRDLTLAAEAKSEIVRVQTREALINFCSSRSQGVRLSDLTV
ncbi:MAG: bifunctional UDP-sugar hydrolase/5'-nucleotidase [Terrimicrobiaceae bacterium]|nr:bifunctional UDP-sugar hydrolase/5'-nucleotidase [Terrimicrobiaceae bacterium]